MRASPDVLFQSTLARRRHRAAARALAVALGVVLIGGFGVLWAQGARGPVAPERLAVPALGTTGPSSAVLTPASPAGAGVPPVASPTLAPEPSPPQLDRTEIESQLYALQAETPITFEPAGTTLTPEGQQSVRRVVNLLRDSVGTRIRVIGHSAVVGGDHATAMRVSQERAELVAGQLRAGGIAANRLEVVGIGDIEPLPSPAAGRRVVIILI